MKTGHVWLCLLPALTAVLIGCMGAGMVDQKAGNVRLPAVAGQFYSANPERLKLAVQQFLEDALPVAVDKPIAIVVPHAGYLYAGQIMADGFRQVKGQDYATVVILGTNHGRNAASRNFSGISVYPRGAYRTPLGDAPVDDSMASALLGEDGDCSPNTAAQEAEHSIEVQIPFVQVLFPTAKILPVMIGVPDRAQCERLGRALAKIAKGKRILVVASSDLSHFPDYEDACDVDRRSLEAIASFDPLQFDLRVRSLMSNNTPALETCACGEGPILAAMTAAKELGATHGVVVSYANSGDAVADDRSRVVGYGSVVFARGSRSADGKTMARPAALPSSGPLQSADKKALLTLARKSLERFLTTETIPLVRNTPPRLQFPQGVFVTLTKHGELRGCVGLLIDDFPVALATAWTSVKAGEDDPRFEPVKLEELPTLEIEISALTPLRRVSKPTDIVVGHDGVVIRKAGHSGVFLPNVATEQGWGLEELLDNLCTQKAGLPRDAWKSGAQLLVFQADVFSENEYR